MTYERLCSIENLELAFKKARRHKTLKPYVISFEENLKENLERLRVELLLHTYQPLPLQTFILRDPKTRKISKSDFRDRVVHHVVCNIIEHDFDKTFISDSCANRLGKGSLYALKRFDQYKRKISRNNSRTCYVLKADIRHYFDTVDHGILIKILRKKINDERIIWLIQVILSNHKTEVQGKGMPLGNLTSQFFANVYLNELDQYVKHVLKAKCYVRYVDDFVILHTSRTVLEDYKRKINDFLKEYLLLELHPEKSKVILLERRIGFLGSRIFYHHSLLRQKNLFKFENKFKEMKKEYKEGMLPRAFAVERFEGWLTYASHANTYKYRRHITILFNQAFPLVTIPPQLVKKKEENLNQKIQISNTEYSTQKTLYYFKKGMTIQQISQVRKIKEGTVWAHLANLIEYNQCKVQDIIPKQTIQKIQTSIYSQNDHLKDIQTRLNNPSIGMPEINCVLASIKLSNNKRRLPELILWYQHVHCRRTCKEEQRQKCEGKFKIINESNPELQYSRKEFISFINKYTTICKPA
ncbi:MAG: reverse transcriptase domain-containing protein [Nanoarchaeota archaeon]